MKKTMFVLQILLLTACSAMNAQQQDEKKNPYYNPADARPLAVNNKDWKKVLLPQVYDIMREKGTERAWTGPYVHNEKKGVYYCAACGHPLFSSATKFDSQTGWPSFFKPLNDASIRQAKDMSYGMDRDEVVCARCGGHLGHVFDDGPAPTGLRYCMNGYALNFVETR